MCERHGYNIPEIVPLEESSVWLSEEGARALHAAAPLDRQLPPRAKRLLCDAYMCYNIPEIVPLEESSVWLSEEGAAPLDRQLPPRAKRLLCDAYMCLYRSPDVAMYR
ncbi:unnamed protein product [Plutella xylostella]|uniref:(diamondback moth) hypothetical protein n=1 Tax=Plutella xylostella TaxID=51655 RepID=A0A8S4DJD0_PLUXY|nr:unnamed protein product [Plutella xylostella]